MKKLVYSFKFLIIIALLGVCLSGCKVGLVEKNTFTDKVKIVDTYYQCSYIQPFFAGGKVRTFIIHPAVYQVKVEYRNKEFTFSDSKLFHKYKNSIGKEIKATIQQNIYDDNTIEYEVIEIK